MTEAAVQEKPKEYALATLPLVQEMAALYNFGNDLERFETTLIKTVFPSDKPVTNSQLLMFLGVAKAYKLNPFIREIYAFPSKGGIVPIVSVDGWISLVQRQASYNGHRFVYEWREGKVGGDLLAATCFIYRKDLQNPIEHTEFTLECVRGTDVWQKYPRRMMTHRAFIQCARYAFGLSGIYDEDEGERILEGTLKATTSGVFQSEIAMPRRMEQLPAQTVTSSFLVPGTTTTSTYVMPEVFVSLSPDQQRKAEVRPEQEAVYNAALEAGKAVGEILFRESPVQQALKAQAEKLSEPADPVQKLDALGDLFDAGLVQKGTDGMHNGIGPGRAKRLYAILNKHKAHTEEEVKEEFLRPLGLEHFADMPGDIYDRVCAWAEGKTEDRG